MKKLVVILGLVVGTVGAGHAQQARFGLKGGLNLATVTGSDIPVKNLTGFSAGVMADFGFTENLALHPELLFAQKGAKISETDPSGASFMGQTRLNYLDLPVLLRAKTHGFFAEAGPQLGYLVSTKTEVTEVVPGLGTFTTSDTSLDGARRLDLGYVLGVGYQLPAGLEVSARYTGGFLDINKPTTSSKVRNSVFQFQLGYLFGGK